jgi:hypothetical protein
MAHTKELQVLTPVFSCPVPVPTLTEGIGSLLHEGPVPTKTWLGQCDEPWHPELTPERFNGQELRGFLKNDVGAMPRAKGC